MLKRLFEHANRGILLDVVVFVVNVLLMTVLSRQLANLLHQATSSQLARASAAGFCLGLAFLQPIGAILKRRRAHLRNPKLNDIPLGCVFLPSYFFTQLFFLSAASVNLVRLVLGRGHGPARGDQLGLPNEGFIYFFFGLPAIAIVNTILFYFYFQPPKHKPIAKFLESPQAEYLGDICLFLNIIGYQTFWSLLMTSLPNKYPTLASKLSTFAFVALLIYFPPRLFYLAEDGNRPIVWLTMLLANSPIILRFFLAASPGTMSNW
jgi:hypothetical protein